jgi:2'-hydroxyisoflavone reductase
MRLLIFGGTVFLSRAVAEEAVRRGHEVTCACRGSSGSVPHGSRHLKLDRASDAVTAATEQGPFDAVVDVARLPSWVGPAVAALGYAHWVFVSTISVYADPARPGTAQSLPTLEPLTEDAASGTDAATYGALKVTCERLVTAGAASHTVIRPGLIIGPGDPSGRFAYWPARLAGPGPVLAPGSPSDPVQVIDVRDLAAWIVICAEERTPGVFDGTGPQRSWADFLTQIATVAGPSSGGSGAASPEVVWVDQGFLLAQGVAPWAGPESVPLWLPQPDFAGFVGHDITDSLAAGLRLRPLAESARDTLRWLRSETGAPIGGIPREREAELLAAWRSR